MLANSIEQVIEKLQEIINESEDQMSPIGYFAALYQKVTERVKQGIADKYFDDNERMERLDVVFANRYLEAYYAYQAGKPCSKCWELAFEATRSRKLIVLQHLFLGMNAHINLDLGIASAQIAPGEQIKALEGDFMKINEILSVLVNGVQDELARIWPMLKYLDRLAGKSDEALAAFSMGIARDGAWRVAKEAADLSGNELQQYINQKDRKVDKFGRLIYNPGFFLRSVVWFIRIMEKGTVARKIRILDGYTSQNASK
ncbi:MAG: DUF5995 family protein [Cytophagales bacterium]|nr:DUF5995 family protein [Cytophagales bacterium]